MSLVLMNSGALANLATYIAAWDGKRYARLFMGEFIPHPESVIGQIQQAVFSGYSGRILLASWTPPIMSGRRAVTQAARIFWEHDGGAATCWVAGYYVVDEMERLQWAELLPGGPVALVRAGNRVTITPRYSIASRYPVEDED